MKDLIAKAEVLIEALPYIRAFRGKTVVIKYGGAAMTEGSLKDTVILDIILMHSVGMRPVVVHGGGPQIGQAMGRAGITPTFVEGLRVTDAETMRIVETVLVGEINQELVALFNRHGSLAVGLSGKDGGLIRAKKAAPARGEAGVEVDLGQVGEVVRVNGSLLHTLLEGAFIPVIAPTGVDDEGMTYNINADLAAGEVAAALTAEKLVLLTDTDGIHDARGVFLPTVTRKRAARMREEGVISEGMLPKVQACLTALLGGVKKTHIINGTVPHALLLEIFTSQGVGTEIVQ